MGSISLLAAARRLSSLIPDAEDAVYGDPLPSMGVMLSAFLEMAAETEVEHRIGLRLHARATSDAPRHGYRNGYRTRVVQFECGALTLRLPRVRVGGFVPSFLRARYRALPQVAEWLYQALMCGISVSELSRLVERLTGFRPSSRLLAETAERLDAEVKRFKERHLEGMYRYLFLDGAWVKDLVGRSMGRVCVLMAIGVTVDGRKEILGFQRVGRENAGAWIGFLRRLLERGLDLRHLRLVISDEHKGLMDAVENVLGDVDHQLCWAHRMRNIRDAVRATDRPCVVEMLRDVYRADTLHHADRALDAFARTWGEIYPGVVKSIKEDARHLLAFFNAPVQHREYVRTTNPIERTFREVRRWRRGCGAFTDARACDRVFYKVSMLLNERWAPKDLWDDPKRRSAATARQSACWTPPSEAARRVSQAIDPNIFDKP